MVDLNTPKCSGMLPFIAYSQSGRIGADEEIDDTKGKTMEEIEDMIEQRELKAGTQILEMVSQL